MPGFWFEWITNGSSSPLKALNQGAASNRLSEAHTEWLRAQIWSKKWRFAERGWATAESGLFDSGSKMSGRSKCTAGGDEESSKRSRETEPHASHKHIVDIHTGARTDSYYCASPFGVHMTPLSLHIAQCCSIKATLKHVAAEWLIRISCTCNAKGFNFTLSEGEEHWLLSSL